MGWKGIHAAAYRHRPQVGFVIHTHQDYATCVGVGGKALSGLNHPLLGNQVPCGSYGMPSTKKLQKGVEAAMVQHPQANAIFMRQHGALCMAEDFEKAFEIAQELKQEGKVRHVGMSFHDSAEVLDKILTDRPELEFVQLQFNYVDYNDPNVQSRLCYEVCEKHGKPVIVMEPVKGGTLANVPQEAEKPLFW